MTAITIIGAGNMARGIATRALAGGHAVQILARDESGAGTLAGELTGTVTAGSLTTAVTGDIVVLALPYDAALAVAEQLRDGLTGKVVVDISNPVDFATFDRLVTPDDSSAAQELQKVIPASKVVKGFNTVFAGTLVAGAVDGHKLDVALAADDAEAKDAVAALVESSGMRAIDAGPLKRAHQLEGVGFLHMAVQGQLGNTWSTAVKIVGA
ncbi:NADP oxidoreductase [Georgenia yuyongxinii]|uniref:NADP oxidoreductase n=1 Tax=Georgenia yuyongxinii TaxID=2589797 RepID=A0A5B8C7B1_9MICO|nr:NAD(P)-binding domain-containing protein [Georgenia yuyongxinii]QDC25235.1 NADP oxidoreductase [Georgenia yuyongxinii]